MGKNLEIAQYAEFAAAVLRQLPRDIPSGEAQYWIEQQDKLKERLRGLLAAKSAPTESVPDLADWQKFYREVFCDIPSFSGPGIPKDPGGYNWVLPIAKGMTANRAWEAARKLFPCYSYLGDNLDQAVPTNERTAKHGGYILRVRDRVVADDEFANRSANWIAKRKLATMTLTERIVLELWYFWKFGKHLDIQNWTLCAGSRDFNGYVPSARWNVDGFEVYWFFLDCADDYLRARSAVS